MTYWRSTTCTFILGNEIEVVAVERRAAASRDRHRVASRRRTRISSASEPDDRQRATGRDAHGALEEDETVELVYRLLHEAVAQRASDLHIEATETGVSVRFRVDGVLHDVMQLPKSRRKQLIARVKVMTAMDISDHRLPQDGRMTLVVDERPVDVRAVVLPTAYGESHRVTDPRQAPGQCGRSTSSDMSPSSLTRLRVALHHAWGLVRGDGTDGLREVDDVVRRCRRAQRPRTQHHHRRGSHRVPDTGHEADAGEPARRSDASRPHSDRSCAPIPTSCSSARFATSRLSGSPRKQR